MKTYAILTVIALLLVIAACAPAAAPSFERNGDQVVITVAANQDLYDVRLVALNAATDDERCGVQSQEDIICRLGAIPEGQTATVEAVSVGEMYCAAWAHLSPPASALNPPRPFACDIE